MKFWSSKKLFMIVSMVMIGAVAIAMIATPTGTWEYSVPDAPYEYNSGKMIVEKENDEYKITLETNHQKFKASDVKYAESTFTFHTYVESEYVSFKIKVSDKAMKGTVSYSEGDLEITATKL